MKLKNNTIIILIFLIGLNVISVSKSTCYRLDLVKYLALSEDRYFYMDSLAKHNFPPSVRYVEYTDSVGIRDVSNNKYLDRFFGMQIIDIDSIAHQSLPITKFIVNTESCERKIIFLDSANQFYLGRGFHINHYQNIFDKFYLDQNDSLYAYNSSLLLLWLRSVYPNKTKNNVDIDSIIIHGNGVIKTYYKLGISNDSSCFKNKKLQNNVTTVNPKSIPDE